MFRQGRELLHGLAFGGDLEAQFLAGFGLAIEGLPYRCRSAHLAQQQHLHLELAAFVLDVQFIAEAHFAGGLGLYPVRQDPA